MAVGLLASFYGEGENFACKKDSCAFLGRDTELCCHTGVWFHVRRAHVEAESSKKWVCWINAPFLPAD